MGKPGNSLIKTVILHVLILAALVSSGQVPYFSRARFALPMEEPVFQVAAQDSSGYLWLGSDRGLFRFDGKDFVKFSPARDSLEILVTALYVSPANVLWVGCKDGSIFSLERSTLSPFEPEEGTSEKAISDILEDPDGHLWWSTYGEGVYMYNGERVYNFNHEDGLSDNYVYELELDAKGAVIAATDNGLSRLGWDGEEKKSMALAVNSKLPDIIVRSMTTNDRGETWLGFHDAGIGYLDREMNDFNDPFDEGEWTWGPMDDMVFSGKFVWFGTSSMGIVQLDLSGGSSPVSWDSDERGNKFGRIHDLARDSEGNIWVLSSNGLYRSTGTRLQYLYHAGEMPLDNIHALVRDSNGNLWFSNDEGLFRYDLSRSRYDRFLAQVPYRDIKFMCLLEDRHGFIWAGTFDHGLFRLDPNNGSYRQVTEKEGLVNDNVLSISSHHDTLWTATLGGASRIILHGPGLNSRLDIFSYNQDNGLVNTFIYDVYEDPGNRLWFATDGDGICVYSNGQFQCYDESSGLGDEVIYSVTGDPSGNIWFSTASDGIYRYDGREFRHFGIGSGLRSLEVSCLEIIHNQVIIVHGLGVDVLQLPSMNVLHFAGESGLFEMAPELNAIHADPEGFAWIGSRNGIIRYHTQPAEIATLPRTLLEKMSVLFRPVDMTPGLKLGSGRNHISFKYAGIWLTNPEKVIYKVRLEGYDIDWKETFDMTATYSSLPPGKYTFRVVSALDANFTNAHEASYSFTISRPFWASIWFIALILALIGGSVYLYISYRENRLRKEEQLKKEKVEFEFQLLKNQVNPHFLFNSFSTLISLIEDDREQAMQYTEKLSDFFRKVLQLKETEIIPLNEEMTLIEDYLFILSKRYGDLITVEKRLEEAVLGTFIPPMTLQMLIENAVKHNIISKDSPLHIRIYAREDSLVVENTNRPKRHKEASTGIGLENISRRYLLLSQKDIRIESNDDVFRVILPLI